MSTRSQADEAAALAAERWLGTPYRHQGTCRGVGCDCLGLLRGVWRDVVGPEPVPVAPYEADWAERTAGEPLLDALSAHLVATRTARRGVVLAFRWNAGAAAKHCGVMIAPDRMVHAYAGHGVVTSALVPAWRRRIVGLFAFPLPQSRTGS